VPNSMNVLLLCSVDEGDLPYTLHVENVILKVDFPRIYRSK
jgi:hypothetical protein